MEKRRLFPIGIQTFSELIKKGFVYIDKTEYIYRMTHMESSYVFLGRPRRFGKSLLTSTLHSYFAGGEGTVLRSGDREDGNGVEFLSGAPLRHEPGQAHGQGETGGVS